MVPGQRTAAPDSVDWRPELPPFDVASCSHIVEAHFNTDPLQTIFALWPVPPKA